MSKFIVTDRKTDYLLPPSLDDWLNQDHLARFIVEVVDQLDLSNLTRQYAGVDQAGAGDLRFGRLPLHCCR
jgi:hypothetical protein